MRRDLPHRPVQLTMVTAGSGLHDGGHRVPRCYPVDRRLRPQQPTRVSGAGAGSDCSAPDPSARDLRIGATATAEETASGFLRCQPLPRGRPPRQFLGRRRGRRRVAGGVVRSTCLLTSTSGGRL